MAAGGEQRRRGAQGVDGANHVDAQQALELLVGDGEQRVAYVGAGVGYDALQASRAFLGLGHSGGQGVGVGDVALGRKHYALEAGEIVKQSLAVNIGGGHEPPFRGEAARGCKAYAGSRTCDEYSFLHNFFYFLTTAPRLLFVIIWRQAAGTTAGSRSSGAHQPKSTFSASAAAPVAVEPQSSPKTPRGAGRR